MFHDFQITIPLWQRPRAADAVFNPRVMAQNLQRRPDARRFQLPEAVGESAHRWTFLTNHSHVLVLLNERPELVLREVALAVGITERAVQRIVQELEEEGFIEREKVGRRNYYRVLKDQPLRHPLESHRTIGDLLNLVAGRKRR